MTALLFEPFKNWVQDYLDKLFYKKRYDYRKTLIEFGRDLNSETDLDSMLTLDHRPAVAHSDGRSHGDLPVESRAAGAVHAGQVVRHSHKPAISTSTSCTWRGRSGQAGHLFFDNTHTRHARNPGSAATRFASWTCNYYIPCTVMNRMIAVLGLGKTSEGDFLSTEDVQLLETLAGYVGIALQNARLYKSLESKAEAVRAAEGVQREHRRIHQRWRAGR